MSRVLLTIVHVHRMEGTGGHVRTRCNLLIVGVVIGLIAASCGGSSDDAASSGSETTATTSGASDASTTTSAESTETTEAPDTGGGATESTATVTIDGVDYVFDDASVGATCDSDFFGGFFAVLRGEDMATNFEVELWNEGTGDGTRLPRAGMKVEANGEILDLEADPETSWPAAEAGSSYVGPFTYEGNSASGTIHFINTEVAYNADLAPLEPIVAEFEVTCADG